MLSNQLVHHCILLCTLSLHRTFGDIWRAWWQWRLPQRLMVCCSWCEFQERINIHVQICKPVLAINLSRHIGTKINMIHWMSVSVCVCVYRDVCELIHVCDAPNASLSLLTTPHSRLEQDMDHRCSLLRCRCSPSDYSVQLDHRSCSHSLPQLASEGDKYDNYPKYQALLFIPY